MTCLPKSLPSSLQVTCANSSCFKYVYSWSSQHPNFSQAWVLSLNNLLFFTLQAIYHQPYHYKTCISFMISISCIPFSDFCQPEFMITSWNIHLQQPSTQLKLQIFLHFLHFHYPSLIGVLVSLDYLNAMGNQNNVLHNPFTLLSFSHCTNYHFMCLFVCLFVFLGWTKLTDLYFCTHASTRPHSC